MANEFKVKKGLIVQGSGSVILDIQGSQGQLFSVTDNLSGSLFSVNDISGLPILQVSSDDSVKLGTFNAEAIKVSGSVAIITGSLQGTSSFATSASYALTAQTLLGSVTSASFASTASFVSNAFIQSGNSFGATALLGTNDNQSLALETSGSTRLFISSSGNIGIGTLTPNAKLDISGSVNISGSGTQIPFQITSGSTSLMFVSSSGNVGIGTTSPTAKLHIINTGQFLFNTNNLQIASSGLSAFFYNNTINWSPSLTYTLQRQSGAIGIHINTSDNVGIGKTSPNATLDVNGNTIISGSLTVTQGITGSITNAVSSSYAATASYADNFTVAGTITAQKLVVQTITSSIVYSSGSNIFGSQLTDVQSFTGSLQVTGSGNHYIVGGNVGIGTTSPTYLLNVQKDLGNGDFTIASLLNNNATAGGTTLRIARTGSTTRAASINFSDTWYAGILREGGNNTTRFSIGTGTDTSATGSAITIQTNGNIGIGKASPTAKLDVSGSAIISGDITGSNALFTGTITAQKLVVQQVTSSIIYSSGSNIFGNDLSNTHQFTGSVFITGSNFLFNNNRVIDSSLTGSMTVLSSSFASTASLALQVSTSISTQNLQHNVLFVDTSGPGYIQVDGGLRYNPNQDLLTTTSSYANQAASASYVLNSISSSLASTASYADNFTVAGTITAQKLVVQTITSSIIYSSGSNQFGNNLTDIQSFTGSLRVTGSGNHYIVGGNVGIGKTTSNATLDVNGNTIITGSLTVTGTALVNNSLLINDTKTASIGVRTLSSIETGSYTSTFYNYTIASGSNARSGQVMIVWNGGSIQYTDISTLDIGSTATIVFTASLSGPNLNLTTVLPSAAWTIKTLANLL